MTEQETIPKTNKEFRKRTHIYAFSNLKDLKNHFRIFIPPAEIEQSVADAHHNFVKRKGVSASETQLQFIKKCEINLLKKIRG